MIVARIKLGGVSVAPRARLDVNRGEKEEKEEEASSIKRSAE